MGKQRVEYIDYLRGLCVIWVVWFHTTHPNFVNYPFRIPLFFFVSGIFFKTYPWRYFWRKKVNQLVIPFLFFYIIYYLFFILSNAVSNHDFTSISYSSFWELFGLYTTNETFVVNPPLWFICALVDLQLLLYFFAKNIKNRWALIGFAILLSLSGLWYIQKMPTPFMFGRSLKFFIYYVLGYTLGKPLIAYLEKNTKRSICILLTIVMFIILYIVVLQEIFIFNDKIIDISDYVEIIGFIVVLIVMFKYIHKYRVMYPLKYFGMNSYIVLGMHEIYHTSFRVLLERVFGEITITIGCIQTLMTLLALWPTIWFFNKYTPALVAKKDYLPMPKS